MKPKIIVVDDANQALREMAAQAHLVEKPGVLLIETPAEKTAKAARQTEIMSKFFGRLNGRERRGLRAAERKVSGRRESFADMTARLTAPQFAPAPPPDPTPKSSDDDRGEDGSGASVL